MRPDPFMIPQPPCQQKYLEHAPSFSPICTRPQCYTGSCSTQLQHMSQFNSARNTIKITKPKILRQRSSSKILQAVPRIVVYLSSTQPSSSDWGMRSARSTCWPYTFARSPSAEGTNRPFKRAR